MSIVIVKNLNLLFFSGLIQFGLMVAVSIFVLYRKAKVFLSRIREKRKGY